MSSRQARLAAGRWHRVASLLGHVYVQSLAPSLVSTTATALRKFVGLKAPGPPALARGPGPRRRATGPRARVGPGPDPAQGPGATGAGPSHQSQQTFLRTALAAGRAGVHSCVGALSSCLALARAKLRSGGGRHRQFGVLPSIGDLMETNNSRVKQARTSRAGWPAARPSQAVSRPANRPAGQLAGQPAGEIRVYLTFELFCSVGFPMLGPWRQSKEAFGQASALGPCPCPRPTL